MIVTTTMLAIISRILMIMDAPPTVLLLPPPLTMIRTVLYTHYSAAPTTSDLPGVCSGHCNTNLA